MVLVSKARGMQASLMFVLSSILTSLYTFYLALEWILKLLQGWNRKTSKRKEIGDAFTRC